MKHLGLFLSILCITFIANISMADETSSVVVVTPPPTVLVPATILVPSNHPVALGFGMSLGVPQGFGISFVVQPGVRWAEASVSFTDNVLSPGFAAGLKLDPVSAVSRFPLGFVADVEGGFAGNGNIPGHSADLPSVSYSYANLYGGLRIGRPDGFRFFLEMGPTYLNANTSNFQSVVGNKSTVIVGNPNVKGWVVPTASMGFSVVWDINKVRK
jgi:hypothetical protein